MTIPLSDLEAYLDEALPAERMAEIEGALRKDSGLLQELAAINGRRDAGVHSLGEIWRRHRLTCPPRDQLAAHLLGTVPLEVSRYIKFHIQTVGCRLCQANLTDLQNQQAEAAESARGRRRKYFQSSAGYLGREKRGSA
jgi:hypothetical protein